MSWPDARAHYGASRAPAVGVRQRRGPALTLGGALAAAFSGGLAIPVAVVGGNLMLANGLVANNRTPEGVRMYFVSTQIVGVTGRWPRAREEPLMSTNALRFGCWAAAIMCAVVAVVAQLTGATTVLVVAAPLVVIFVVATVLATRRRCRAAQGRRP